MERVENAHGRHKEISSNYLKYLLGNDKGGGTARELLLKDAKFEEDIRNRRYDYSMVYALFTKVGPERYIEETREDEPKHRSTHGLGRAAVRNQKCSCGSGKPLKNWCQKKKEKR